MLRYFRINDPYRLVVLLVIMTLLYVPLFINSPPITFTELKSFLVGQKITEGFSLYSEIIDTTPPLAAWWYGVVYFVIGKSLTAAHIIGFLILFLQSAFWGISLINKKAFEENTYLPSFIFSLLLFISVDSFSLTSELPAFGCILLALNNLLKELEFRAQQDETTFNLGVFIGLASLFNFSYVIYLPGCLFILIVFTRNSVRKYLLLTFGFLMPHLITLCIYFYNNSLSAAWEFYYLGNLRFANAELMSLKSLLILFSLPLFFLFVSFFVLNREGRLTKYQSQAFQALFLWFIIAFIQLFLTENLRPQSLLPLALPTSFFLTHFLLIIRKRKLAEMCFWILIIGIPMVAYSTRYNKISAIDYNQLFVKATTSKIVGKRILVLDESPSLFLQNNLAAPFTDWASAKIIFEQPDYYENLLLVNRLFEKDLPQVIVDPKNLMENYFSRLPNLKLKYKKTREGYELINS